MSDPIISTNGGDRRADPEIASAVCIYQKGGIKVWRKRALVGWRHQDDTAGGRRVGKIWCWTSENEKSFQVYDENFNRSENAGQVRFCGVANFTMIRMFHPYWARNGAPPQDMKKSHKRWCRERYTQLMRKHERLQQRQEGEDSSSSDGDERPRKRRPAKRSTGRKATTAKRQKKRRANTSESRSIRLTSSEDEVLMFPSGSSDLGSNSDTSDRPLMARQRRANRPIDISDDEDSDEPQSMRQRQRRDVSEDQLLRGIQKRQAKYNDGEVGDHAGTNNDARVATSPSVSPAIIQEAPLKQEPGSSQLTESYGGVSVEALPQWEAGAVYDAEAFLEGRLEQVTDDVQSHRGAQIDKPDSENGGGVVIDNNAEDMKEITDK